MSQYVGLVGGGLAVLQVTTLVIFLASVLKWQLPFFSFLFGLLHYGVVFLSLWMWMQISQPTFVDISWFLVGYSAVLLLMLAVVVLTSNQKNVES